MKKMIRDRAKMLYDIKRLRKEVPSKEYERLLDGTPIEELPYSNLIQVRASLSHIKYTETMSDQSVVQRILWGKEVRWLAPKEFHFSYWSQLAEHEVQLIELRTGKKLIEDVYVDDDGDDDDGFPIQRHLISYKISEVCG